MDSRGSYIKRPVCMGIGTQVKWRRLTTTCVVELRRRVRSERGRAGRYKAAAICAIYHSPLPTSHSHSHTMPPSNKRILDLVARAQSPIDKDDVTEIKIIDGLSPIHGLTCINWHCVVISIANVDFKRAREFSSI